jgi:hypothetical protein
MLAMHGPPVRVFALLPVILVLFLVCFGIAAIARRRAHARLNRMRAVREAMTPVRYGPTESFPMRRFVWGGLVMVAVIVALFVGVFKVRTEQAFLESQGATLVDRSTWIEQPAEAPTAISQAPDFRPPPLGPPEARAQVSRKSRVWWKADKAAPAETPHQWKGVIERTCVGSLTDSKQEKYKAISDALVQQLHLRVQPPMRFFETPAYFKIDDTTTDPVKHDPDIGDYVRISYSVEVTQLGWQELSRLERAERAGERMELAARGLGLLTVLLGAVAAYVRLDDWTKGYYSGRLFLAGFALTTGICIAIAYA